MPKPSVVAIDKAARQLGITRSSFIATRALAAATAHLLQQRAAS
jgi:uncharacterized protein (DUF1778 family)